ncbi:hypothetical protein MJL79_28520, partial [Salmonella enterica subsp. enterica serovar Montevideo]|nr:hypothetical protein [Salmonella enterica subsp. enterica serovar Montevideo]
TFVSETDTEVIAHLVNWELKQGGTLREAVLRAIPQLRGAYGTDDAPERQTLLLLHHHPLPAGCSWLDQHSLRNAGELDSVLANFP